MPRMKQHNMLYGGLLSALLLLSACTTTPPNNRENICDIFQQYPHWYWATDKVRQRWWVPISVQMAIMHQESRFSATAKPPRTRLLWIIPWKRPSSSYGYTQALKQTWETYQRSSGHTGADRDNFSDAADFIGWYVDQAYRKLRIPKNDTYHLYLAYHEGLGGFQRRTYLGKPWLMGVARKVAVRGKRFYRQLNACRDRLKRKPWYRFW